jgi:peroxiredoxin
MTAALTVALSASWILIALGGWLAWQLLRQNGRILLRLDELEFEEESRELSDESQGSTDHSVRAAAAQTNNGAYGSDVPGLDERANRFANRSLARTKIKRDGLKAGIQAPDFRLPCLDGTEVSLQDFRGRRVLLVFSDPHCGPCNALAPHLELFHRERPDISVLMISRGDPKENRSKMQEHRLTFPVVLQRQWETSRRYAMFATPVAYLIDETGIILEDLAVGVEAILALMTKAAQCIPTTAVR